MPTMDVTVELGRQALMTMLLVAAPVMLAGLVVGVIVSILQAATQVQEQTLAFVPKILAMLLTVLLLMPWMIGMVVEFTRTLLTQMPALIR